jgi:glycosyltransferase involved in cell wall biosynthesis
VFERDLVLLYGPPWAAATRFSKHHMAAYFASRGWRVLYVEAPLSPLGARRGRAFVHDLWRTFQPPQRAAQRLWVRRHFVPVPYHAAFPFTSRRAANRIGQRLLAPTLKRDLARLGFRKPILIAGLPHAADLVGLVPRRGLVYHCADDYAHASGFPDTLPQLEAELCRRADLVIATSETLCRERRRFNPCTYWVPNGVELEHFARAAPPAAELARVRRPIVGFVGGLSEWVDIDLVAALAQARPDWSFVLVGPIGTDTSSLLQRDNVALLGPRAYETVPGYLAAMDVALIPFKHTPVTYHADPIKAYEYLAAGLPVVATDLPALRRLANIVRLADTREAFEREIAAAIAEGRHARRAERQAEAARHSWTSRFEQVERLIGETFSQRACAS